MQRQNSSIAEVSSCPSHSDSSHFHGSHSRSGRTYFGSTAAVVGEGRRVAGAEVGRSRVVVRRAVQCALGGLLLGGLPTVALAQTGLTQDASLVPVNSTAIPQVVVTPTRSAQTVDVALSSVTVIDREEIERLQPRDLADLLRARASIDVVELGAFGKQTSVFTRGANAGQTLLIIDGVRMGSVTAGSASWQYVPVEAIKRVEIVRGPRTSIYGADAVGGVIQVFTRRGDGAGVTPEAAIGFGSDGRRQASIGLRGGREGTRFSLTATHDQADGVDVLPGVGDDDRDGFRNTSLNFDLQQRLAAGLTLFGGLHLADGRTDFDGFQDRSDFRHAAGRIGVNWMINDLWQSELRLARSIDESDTFSQGTFSSRFDTRRDQIDWLNHFDVSSSTRVSLGYEGLIDRVDSTTDFDETRRRNDAGYAIVQTRLGPLDTEASLRYDDNEQFGGETTGQLALGYAFADSWRTRVAYGTAFSAPSFNLLYFPGFSNPDLKPERARTAEIGLVYARDAWRLESTLFETRVRDLIISPPPNFLPENVDRARIRGLELEAQWRPEHWRLTAALTLLDGENRGEGADRGNELPRRPPASFRLDVDREFGAYSLGTSLIAQSRRFENASNTERLPGYATLDLRGEWRFHRDWRLGAKVGNLFDRDVRLARDTFNGVDYQQPGRTFFVQLRWQPAR